MRMARWNVTLSTSAVEYAARALCMGLRALRQGDRWLLCDVIRGRRRLVDHDPALGAGRGAWRYDWPKARDRISRAQARIATGLDARLHDDRDRGDDRRL